MTIFTDTSAFYALLDRTQARHAQAGQIWSHLLDQREHLVCSNYVVVEATTLLQRRLGLQAARDFTHNIVPLLQIEWVTPTTHTVALQTLFGINERDLSLVDCVSFVMMNQLGINTVFAFDRLFIRQGFTCLT